MKVAVFSSHKFEKKYLQNANKGKHDLTFLEMTLTANTAVLAKDYEAVSLFVTDEASAHTLTSLKEYGVKYIVLRSAGFNHIDLEQAKALGFRLARVPSYSPYAIAEHTIALMLGLNRKLVRAHNRVRDLNFSLDGLIGFDMHGKTAGIIGTGKIGKAVISILHGFGCHILAYDSFEDEKLKEAYSVK